MIVISLLGNYKLFNISNNLESEINHAKSEVLKNKSYIDSIENINLLLNHQMDSIYAIIESLHTEDSLLNNQYTNINSNHEETINIINNANTIELTLYFSNFVSSMDTLWKR
jgi:hypothetical protein